MTGDAFEIHRYGDEWTLSAGADVRHLSSPGEGEIEAHVLEWANPKVAGSIRNAADLKAALDRTDHLMGCTEGSDEESELAELAEAVRAFEDDAALTERLNDIVARDGLVSPEKLQAEARLDEIGISEDDLVLIGNAVEREFDCDVLGANSIERCATVGELIESLRSQVGSRLHEPADEDEEQ